MKYQPFILFCLTIIIATQPVMAEPIPDPPPPSDNAAVWYLTAQQLMGNYDEAAKAVIDKWQAPDLEAATDVIENKLFSEMGFIRRGAAQPRCAWAVDFSKDGPNTLLPHLTMLREYGKILAVSGQVRLEQGDHNGAIEDFVAIMRLSRHAADDGSLVGCLVQMSLDNIALQALSKQLHRFDRAQLESLSKQLAALPDRRTVKASISVERLMGQWVGSVAMQAVEEGKYEGLVDLGLMGLGQQPKTDQEREQLAASIKNQLEEFDRFYQRIYENLGLPNAEFIKADKQLEIEVMQSKNPLVRVLMPALGGAYQTERRSKSIRAILNAGIAMRLAGEEGFDSVTDPADGSPFTLTIDDDGLVLSSRLKKKDKPVSLTFSSEVANPLP